MSLLPSRIWIIGASSGIGHALAHRLCADGHDVILSARNEKALNSLAKEYREKPMVLPLDVTVKETVIRAYEAIKAEKGGVDRLIYCAGYWQPMQMASLDSAELEKTFQVNVFGAAYTLEAILPDMRRKKSGHIILVSSTAAYRGLPLGLAYGASKAALSHMAECLKPECDAAGINLQLVSPGFVKTPMTDRNTFEMPAIIPVEKAVDAIMSGLEKKRFEIHFPKRFTCFLKLLRILPYGLYFALIRPLLRK